MYQIKLYDSVPAPKAVTVKEDRIIAAHYYPAWKKGAAELHEGFKEIYDYPERTPLMGYYDEENPEVTDWEIKWCLEHGINCWIYCWYRRKYNVGQPVTEKDLRCAHGIHEGLFRAKYGNLMKFAIMFEAQASWGASDEKDMIENLMPFWLDNYFCKENYLKLDNKPVLFVYDVGNQLKESFGSAENQKRIYDLCREMARERGFDGMIFAEEHRKNDPAVLEDFRARGNDFSFHYCNAVKEILPPDDLVIERQLEQINQKLATAPDFFVPTASCMWDPTPRMEKAKLMKVTPERKQQIWKLSPESYRMLLGRIRERMEAQPKDSYANRILMIDNWNEWDEGHYVSPSYEFGFGFLQAIREEMTERDNLPDYRMPGALGFTCNQNWEEPDLSRYNERGKKQLKK